MKKIILTISLLYYTQTSMAADLNTAANDVCACLKEPYRIVEDVMAKLAEAQVSGDYSKLIQVQGEMMAVINASSKCFDELPSKHPEIDQNETLKNQVMEKVEKQCPNPALQYQSAK